MKKGWQTKRLGDVLEIQNGFAFDSKMFNPSKGMPLIRIRSLKVGVETETRFSGDFDDKYVVHAGDLLIGMDGEFGCYEWKGPPALLNQRVCRLQGFTAELVPRFLFYGVNTHLKAIEDVTGFATVKHLSSKQILDIDFPLPPLPEQRRIVGLLDEAFAGIATAKATAEQNLQNARALFESHLDAVFTRRGTGWEQKTLEEIATTFGRGKSKHRPRNEPKLYGGKYPFIQTGDIRSANHFITEYSQTYSEAGLAQSKLWPKGTICITIAANIAETGILGFDACFPDSVIGVVTNPKEAVIGFVEYLLQSFKVRLQAMGKGSAQANINMGTFENERFPFPPVSEQKQIVAKLDALSAETTRLAALYARKLAALEELKKSLLHQAFAGEL
ncbi:MAG: restriction endonuclease subunit S [Opitutae bacterium]|nr:restriction endonuclease subunit S [Opitutae bacterium]